MASREATPWQIFLIGLITFLVGVSVLGYMVHKYHDWDIVSVTYRESNCVEERNFHKRKGESATFTYCDLMISYDYNGKSYIITDYHSQKNLRLGFRSVNPANPEQTQENWPEYAAGSFLAMIGFICMFVSSLKMIRNK